MRPTLLIWNDSDSHYFFKLPAQEAAEYERLLHLAAGGDENLLAAFEEALFDGESDEAHVVGLEPAEWSGYEFHPKGALGAFEDVIFMVEP